MNTEGQFNEEEQQQSEDPQILEKMIKPNLSKMYFWDINDSPKRIEISFPIPENFDDNLLSFNLSKHHNSISVEMPSAPPIIKGELIDVVKSMDVSKVNGRFVITLQKQNQGLWESVIVGPHSDSKDIDPQSAFILGTE